jgi:hypothetical protein
MTSVIGDEALLPCSNMTQNLEVRRVRVSLVVAGVRPEVQRERILISKMQGTAVRQLAFPGRATVEAEVMCSHRVQL